MPLKIASIKFCATLSETAPLGGLPSSAVLIEGSRKYIYRLPSAETFFGVKVLVFHHQANADDCGSVPYTIAMIFGRRLLSASLKAGQGLILYEYAHSGVQCGG